MLSGKFIIRTSEALHASLKKDAKTQKISLNDLCIKRLETPGFCETLPADITRAIAVLAEIVQPCLVGIVIFGSWARGDSTQLSDVDILVVLKEEAKITRSLYNKWEKAFTSPTKVEPHFVRLPSLDDAVSGLWAEIAMDGLLVYDQQVMVHRYLTHVKRLIATRKIVSRRSHGQNYWVHVGAA